MRSPRKLRGCVVTCRHRPSLQVETLAAGAGLWQPLFKTFKPKVLLQTERKAHKGALNSQESHGNSVRTRLPASPPTPSGAGQQYSPTTPPHHQPPHVPHTHETPRSRPEQMAPPAIPHSLCHSGMLSGCRILRSF